MRTDVYKRQMVVCVTIMYLFVRSKYGRTVQAIREDYICLLYTSRCV